MSTPDRTEVIVDGDLLQAGDADYDDARRVFNTLYDRHPAAIARCASERDVVAALRYASRRGLAVSVRAGGHSAAGFSVADDAVVIDVRGLKAVTVDRFARRARVGAGLTWAELDAATQQFGLAVTGGRMSTTGVAGLTIGSGSGTGRSAAAAGTSASSPSSRSSSWKIGRAHV